MKRPIHLSNIHPLLSPQTKHSSLPVFLLPCQSLKSTSSLRLPLTGALHAAAHIVCALLDSIAHVRDTAPDALARRTSGALDRLAEAARGRADDAADRVREAADCVTVALAWIATFKVGCIPESTTE